MFEQVKEILAKYVSPDIEITENSTLTSDLGLSSFDLVEIVTDFEDEFDIEISDRDIRKLIKVQDIIDYITDK